MIAPPFYYPAYIPSYFVQTKPDPETTAQKAELESKKRTLELKEKELNATEEKVERKGRELAKRQKHLETCEEHQTQLMLENRLTSLAHQEELQEFENKLNKKKEAVEEKRTQLVVAEKELCLEKEILQKRKLELDEREAKLKRKEAALEKQSCELSALEKFRKDLNDKLEEVNGTRKEVLSHAQSGLRTLKAVESTAKEILTLLHDWNPKDLIPEDPISHEPLEFPVMDEYGHSHELPSLLNWLERKKVSPVNNEPYKQPDHHPQNYALRELIEKLEQQTALKEQLEAKLQHECRKVTKTALELTEEMVQWEPAIAMPTEVKKDEIQHMPELQFAG